MADLKLQSIRFRNWMEYKDVALNFPERGLVVVSGYNEASKGAMRSVGAGKTGFGEVVSHTLLGVSSHFREVGPYSRNKQGNTYVCLEALFLGKALKIEMGYKCKELNPRAEGLRYTYDGKEIALGRVEQTREALNKLFGVPPLLARWTVFLDGDRLKFNDLSQAESVELVMSSLRQPPWMVYFDRSKKVFGRFKHVLVEDTTKLDSAKSAISKAEENVKQARQRTEALLQDYTQRKAALEARLKQCETQLQTRRDQLDAYQTEREQIAQQIRKLTELKANEAHKLEIEFNEINDRIMDLQSEIQENSTQRTHAVVAQTRASTDLNNYSQAKRICPTCKQAIVKPIDPQHVEELAVKKQTADQELAKIEAQATKLQENLKAQQAQLKANSQKRQDLGVEHAVRQLSLRDEKLENLSTDLLNQIHRLENSLKETVSDTLLKESEARLAERQNILEESKNELDVAGKQLEDTKALYRMLDYWTVAFSPYGIPNMILREAIAPLNHESRRLSKILTGGTIEVSYATQRELSSGEEKAQLVINVDNQLGSSDFAGNSKGEAGLTNLIISETLSEIGQVYRRIGYRWYDEVLPNHDPIVCKTSYEYLRQLANKLGILVFLVTHDPSAVDYADHTLIVKKKSEGGETVSTAYFA